MQDLSPIILFVYNRPWHTRQTLEALSKNVLANESRLYIYADGPKTNATIEQLQKVKEVRHIIKEKKWCAEVEIIEREENMGLAKSVISGVTEIVNKYGKIIVMEDDLVSSRYFLKFMNEGLFRYETNPSVFGCSAYFEAVEHSGREAYFDRKGGSWGWATWSRVWKNFIPDAGYLMSQFNNLKQIKEFNIGNYPFYEMLNLQRENKINSWAICFYAYSFLNQGLWLTPTRSLVKNIGFDSSGTHCKNDKSYNVEIFDEEIFINDSLPIEEDKMLRKKRENFIRKKYNISFFSRFLNKIKEIIQKK